MVAFFECCLLIYASPYIYEGDYISNYVIILIHTNDLANVCRNGSENDTEKAPKRHRKSIENARAYESALLE